VRIWDPADGTHLATLSGHSGPVYVPAYSRDGKRLATSGHDRTVRVWSSEDGRELAVFRGHDADVYAVAFAGADRLVSCSQDRTLRVWEFRP